MGTTATAANNCVVREGLCPNAKIVARAHGLPIDAAGNWHNAFTLVFEEESFIGSTIQVMGTPVEGGEWAIVGGTGQLAMATGVIRNRVHKKTSEGNVIELTIQGLCLRNGSKIHCPRNNSCLQILPIKLGAWGGNGGAAQDIKEPPKRLESITIRSGWAVDSIAFSYLDRNGLKHNAGPWGGSGGYPNTIEITVSEFVNEVSGTFGVFEGVTIITSLKITTNMRIYGPFGREQGTPFSVPVQGGKGVTGFFARSGKYLDAIGVYVHPDPVDLKAISTVPVSSSCLGSTFNCVLMRLRWVLSSPVIRYFLVFMFAAMIFDKETSRS